MVLKDAIKGTCERSVESSKAVNDGNGNNIADTYQKKIGIGNFTGNIDLISENVTCICESLNIEGGELPLNNEEGYFFVLKTDCSEEGNINSENIQTAFLTESGKYRKFIRIGGAYTGYGPWKEAPVNENIEFKSEDDKNPSGYTDVDLITDGEKQSSLWRKVSLFAKNVRYLWKLCGSTDISGVADGTLTGAVSKLNTDLVVAKDWKYSTTSFKACTGTTLEGGIEGFLDTKIIPKIEINPTSVNTFESIMGSTGGPSICALTFIYGAAYGAGIAFSYAGDTRLAQFYFNSGNYGIRFF